MSDIESPLRDDGPIPPATQRELERLRGEVVRLTDENIDLDEGLGRAHNELLRQQDQIAALKAEVARLQSERDELQSLTEGYSQRIDFLRSLMGISTMSSNETHNLRAEHAEKELGRVRAEVTAAKADALEEAADRYERGTSIMHSPAAVGEWLRACAAGIRVAELERQPLAADTRAELEGGQR